MRPALNEEPVCRYPTDGVIAWAALSLGAVGWVAYAAQAVLGFGGESLTAVLLGLALGGAVVSCGAAGLGRGQLRAPLMLGPHDMRGARKSARLALGAFAASATTSLGVRGGALSLSAAPDSGIATGRTYSPLLMLTDARGTGDGWHLTVSVEPGEKPASGPAATVEGARLGDDNEDPGVDINRMSRAVRTTARTRSGRSLERTP